MSLTAWVDQVIGYLASLAPADSHLSIGQEIRGVLAVVLVCVICGAVGSLVVGNRMSFFSDALAHCAFAGVALGLLLDVLAHVEKDSRAEEWSITAIMAAFGVLIGVGIAYVRERTSLANDTVIGVFFAGAIGFGAMLFKALNTRSYMSPENFLFGDPMFVTSANLIVLFCLAVVTLGLLAFIYNALVFTSFNPSLARSRQIRLRLCNYLFIVLLALIVNLSLKTVGALLINALLIVPAATAANVARNMRQLFWGTIGLCLLAGVAGPWLSWQVQIPNPPLQPIRFNWAGTIVVFCVVLFFASLVFHRRPRARAIT